MATIVSKGSYITCTLDYSTSRTSSGVTVTYSIYLTRLNSYQSYGTIGYSVTADGSSMGSGSGIKLTVPGNNSAYVVRDASFTVSASAFNSGGFTLAFSTSGDIANFNHSGSAWVSYGAYATYCGDPLIEVWDNGNNTFSFSVTPGGSGTNNATLGLRDVSYTVIPVDSSSGGSYSQTVVTTNTNTSKQTFGPYSISASCTVTVYAATYAYLLSSNKVSKYTGVKYTNPEIAWSISDVSVDSANVYWDVNGNADGSMQLPSLRVSPGPLSLKLNTSGTVSSFSWNLDSGGVVISSVTANTLSSLSLGSFSNIIEDKILSTKADINNGIDMSFSCSFTLTSGSTTKSYSYSRTITIPTPVLKKPTLSTVYAYRTSGSQVTYKGVITLPMTMSDQIVSWMNSFALHYYYTGLSLSNAVSYYSYVTNYEINSEHTQITFTTTDIQLHNDSTKYLYPCVNMLFREDDADTYFELDTVQFSSDQDIKIKDGVVKAAEFIELSEPTVMLQKGGRVYAREFIEPYNEIISDSIPFDTTTKTLTVTGSTIKDITISGTYSTGSINVFSTTYDIADSSPMYYKFRFTALSMNTNKFMYSCNAYSSTVAGKNSSKSVSDLNSSIILNTDLGDGVIADKLSINIVIQPDYIKSGESFDQQICINAIKSNSQSEIENVMFDQTGEMIFNEFEEE